MRRELWENIKLFSTSYVRNEWKYVALKYVASRYIFAFFCFLRSFCVILRILRIFGTLADHTPPTSSESMSMEIRPLKKYGGLKNASIGRRPEDLAVASREAKNNTAELIIESVLPGGAFYTRLFAKNPPKKGEVWIFLGSEVGPSESQEGNCRCILLGPPPEKLA